MDQIRFENIPTRSPAASGTGLCFRLSSRLSSDLWLDASPQGSSRNNFGLIEPRLMAVGVARQEEYPDLAGTISLPTRLECAISFQVRDDHEKYAHNRFSGPGNRNDVVWTDIRTGSATNGGDREG